MEVISTIHVLQRSAFHDFGLDFVVFLECLGSIFSVFGALDAGLKFIDFHGYLVATLDPE